MRLIANRQLTGDYGTVAGEQEFQTTEEIGVQLVKAGLARRADPPKILYETKPARFETPTIQPEAPGVSARDPFRFGDLSYAQPAPVATEGDSVLPKPNVSEQGAADPSGRGRRKGSGTERPENPAGAS